MEPELYDRLFRCHDFISALKLFKEAANKLTDDDIEFMKDAFTYYEKAMKLPRKHWGEETKRED